jgi:glycosyltransferase involved in cell wall biosynthesis
MTKPRTILALFPSLTRGNLALSVLREMRLRNLDVTVAYSDESTQYAPDPAEDFAQDNRLVDLFRTFPSTQLHAIEQEIRNRNVGLILQIGAGWLYRHLPAIKEKFPDVSIVDLLYNDVGHVVNHFLFEAGIDGVIVESDYMRKYVERSSEKSNPNIYIVRSGVALERFAPPAGARTHNNLVVGYLGRMSEEKNPLGFVALAEQIYTALPDTIFPVSGEGNLAADVRERIQLSFASGAFQWEAYHKDSAAMLSQLDVLVVPSLLDGRPVVIMEANACGVPVIAAPVGAIPEMIEDGVNGHLVAIDLVDRLLEILSRWRNDPQSLAEIKASSRIFAERAFDRRRMLDSYEQIFREFLDFRNDFSRYSQAAPVAQSD